MLGRATPPGRTTSLTQRSNMTEYSFYKGIRYQNANPRQSQRRNKERARGAQLPRRRVTMGEPNHCGGAPKGPNSIRSTFFSTVHLLPKDLSFERVAPNLFLAPGAI